MTEEDLTLIRPALLLQILEALEPLDAPIKDWVLDRTADYWLEVQSLCYLSAKLVGIGLSCWEFEWQFAGGPFSKRLMDDYHDLRTELELSSGFNARQICPLKSKARSDLSRLGRLLGEYYEGPMRQQFDWTSYLICCATGIYFLHLKCGGEEGLRHFLAESYPQAHSQEVEDLAAKLLVEVADRRLER